MRITTTQNIAEFWNVATRAVAENGLGLPPAKVIEVVEGIIEPVCAILVEPATFSGMHRKESS